jgi:hypothetical protein
MLLFCPSCQRQLRLPENATGKQVQCPACQNVFTAGDEHARQQIRVPPPRSLPVAPPPDDSLEEEAPRPRRIRRDDDDADFLARRDDYAARQRVQGAAVWFFVAAGITMVVFVINFTMAVSQGAFQDNFMGDREAALAGMICGILGCGGVILTGNVLIIVAGLQLRSFGIKGWVITGIVLAFLHTALFGLGSLGNVFMLIIEPREALEAWAPLTVLLSGTAAFLNCFAAIRAIMALNNQAVYDEFERRNAPRRRRRRRD